jgi:hypothetical protein
MKTNELSGKALDWAVAKCEGIDPYILDTAFYSAWCNGRFNFSSDWAQGGPIIERERLGVGYTTEGGSTWLAAGPQDVFYISAPTPLTAAMRCYVASKLGDDVNVPKELV